jgi:hypothetical protein
MKDVLVIGSGECGVSVVSTYKKKYELKNDICFNSANDNKNAKNVTLLKKGEDADGSGRNPLITLNKIIPANEELIREKVSSKIDASKTKQIILISSAGGGFFGIWF